MTTIHVKFEPVDFKEVSEKVSKNIAFSCVQGINQTAKDVQKAERIELAQELMLRTPASRKFLENQVAKISFASLNQNAKGGARSYAEIFINPAGGKGKGGVLLLNALAIGGINREPAKGSIIAQPLTGSPSRPSTQSPIAKPLTFQQMKLKKNKSGEFKGKAGTFTIEGSGVFQRIDKNTIRKIYDYRTTQTLGQELDWFDVAEKVIKANLLNNILTRYNAKK